MKKRKKSPEQTFRAFLSFFQGLNMYQRLLYDRQTHGLARGNTGILDGRIPDHEPSADLAAFGKGDAEVHAVAGGGDDETAPASPDAVAVQGELQIADGGGTVECSTACWRRRARG